MNVFDSATEVGCKFLITYFGFKSFFASFGFLMIYPNVLGRLTGPYCEVSVTSFEKLSAGGWNVAGYVSFHCVKGYKTAGLTESVAPLCGFFLA
jgi:hypothetical protein